MNPLRKLPSVDRVLSHPRVVDLELRHELVRRVVVDAIAAERARVLAALAKDENPEVTELDAMAERVRARLDAWLVVHPRPVLNGTGVLLHTNLGRAPLSEAARAAVDGAARSCDLEIDLASGKRGSRLAILRPLLAALFEAEDSLVVNNGAAALLLACTALASAGERGGVILSRGQHVEIGDSFRVAEMAAAGGVPLRAIGSTNRTHLRDYVAALDAHPEAAILWAHQSNFVQEGFVHEPALRDLAQLARERGVALIADLGSGSLGLGVPSGEPRVAEYLEAGASVVTFSGDKLVAGPQAGILAGDADRIARCKRHPLARALRCGKLALAALHATAIAHASPGVPALPLHRMIALELDELRARAERLREALGWSADCVRDNVATIGGGSLPGQQLDSVALVVPGKAQVAARTLRALDPPLVGRSHEGELWLDLRTLADVDDAVLVAALRRLS